ncbi:hypothetical protein [Pleurocapsa sp. PCC 7319]|uniref:hypothetical protein n=1 Tax=Pleurocapsa sp. PCC 7319 TaxID=118161 RepID=UPI00130E9EAB|nr:hypothetical protein [Pleurocapsa sp. PCC 7319]
MSKQHKSDRSIISPENLSIAKITAIASISNSISSLANRGTGIKVLAGLYPTFRTLQMKHNRLS